MEKFPPLCSATLKWLAEVKEKLIAKRDASGLKVGEAPPDPAALLAAEAAEKAKEKNRRG